MSQAANKCFTIKPLEFRKVDEDEFFAMLPFDVRVNLIRMVNWRVEVFCHDRGIYRSPLFVNRQQAEEAAEAWVRACLIRECLSPAPDYLTRREAAEIAKAHAATERPS